MVNHRALELHRAAAPGVDPASIGIPTGRKLDDDQPIHYQAAMSVNSLTHWVSTVFARSEPGNPDPEEYFTPRLAQADRHMQDLATRLKGVYQRGALDWSALSAAAGTSGPGDAVEARWDRGSSVTKRLHGLEIEVTVGVQTLATGDLGEGTVPRWLVLVPGVTVAAGPRSGPLAFNRFDASFSADDEVATGADRLRPLLARGAAASAPAAPLPSMPASVTNARDRVLERASKVVCAASHLFVIGRPVPRGPQDPRRFGQGTFEVDAVVDLVDRARALAHALAG